MVSSIHAMISTFSLPHALHVMSAKAIHALLQCRHVELFPLLVAWELESKDRS